MHPPVLSFFSRLLFFPSTGVHCNTVAQKHFHPFSNISRKTSSKYFEDWLKDLGELISVRWNSKSIHLLPGSRLDDAKSEKNSKIASLSFIDELNARLKSRGVRVTNRRFIWQQLARALARTPTCKLSKCVANYGAIFGKSRVTPATREFEGGSRFEEPRNKS